MHTFAPQQQPTQEATSALSTKPDEVFSGQHRESNIPHLQRAVGNQAAPRPNPDNSEAHGRTQGTSRFAHDFSRIPLYSTAPVKLQAKLKINTSGDIYEQEADRVSEQVMQMAEPQLQRACPCGEECLKCQTKQTGQAHERLQTHRVPANDTGQTAAPPIVHEVLASPGQPLDPATRAFMETRFGHDFSRVRVHSDARAAESAQEVNAIAYTVGHQIAFGAGQYQPQTSAGQKLLAHELTHVVQQNADSVKSNHTILSSDALHPERAASQAAASVLIEERAPIISPLAPPALSLQRQGTGVGRRDAGVGQRDAGNASRPDAGVAPDAGSSPASPGTTPSSPSAPAGLTATLIAMNVRGIVDPANCARNRMNRAGHPVAFPLGVWDLSVTTRAPWINAIEFVWGINGVIRAGVTFDIKRVRGTSVCEIPRVGAAWRQVNAEPLGTPDDIDNADECLAPQSPGQRIFSKDSPGFSRANLRGAEVAPGILLSPTAVAVRARYTFEEWVEATIPGVGANLTISPRVPWHATLSLEDTTPAPASPSWQRTPGAPNDIGAGSIPLNCTTGTTTPGSPVSGTTPRQTNRPDSGTPHH